MFRRIHANAAKLFHGRLPCLRSATTSFWHIDAVGGRPHHQCGSAILDYFVASLLAMTILCVTLVLAFLCPDGRAVALNDPYSIMAPERVPARHHVRKSPLRTRHLPPASEKAAAKHSTPKHAVIAHGSPGVVLPTPLPRTQLIPPEGGGAPLVRPAPLQQGTTVLPGASNPIPNLPHGPETFQNRASRCAFQQQLYNVPGNLGTQYMGSCVQ
jgi:hypothetical protein